MIDEYADKNPLRLINSIIAVGLITTVYGIFQHFSFDFMPWKEAHGERVFSTLANPNLFSDFLIIPLILVFW